MTKIKFIGKSLNGLPIFILVFKKTDYIFWEGAEGGNKKRAEPFADICLCD
jgi:hypothetical protein